MSLTWIFVLIALTWSLSGLIGAYIMTVNRAYHVLRKDHDFGRLEALPSAIVIGWPTGGMLPMFLWVASTGPLRLPYFWRHLKTCGNKSPE